MSTSGSGSGGGTSGAANTLSTEALLARLRNELAMVLQRDERPARIAANLPIGADEYLRLVIEEAIREVWVDAIFAASGSRSADSVREKAVAVASSIIKRDERLFAERGNCNGKSR